MRFGPSWLFSFLKFHRPAIKYYLAGLVGGVFALSNVDLSQAQDQTLFLAESDYVEARAAGAQGRTAVASHRIAAVTSVISYLLSDDTGVSVPKSGYAITDLGSLSTSWDYSEARGINEQGEVVGASRDATGKFHAVLFNGGTIRDLGFLSGGTESFARGINRHGQVVGTALNSSDFARPFIWSSVGGMMDLGTIGGNYGHARSINDAGQVVGYSEATPWSFKERGFSWAQGSGIAPLPGLSTPGGVDTSNAYAINASGHVAGWAINSIGEQMAILWRPNPSEQGNLAGGYSEVYALNDSGQMAGMSTVEIGSPGHATRWNPASGPEDIGHIQNYEFSYGKGINSAGSVVGYASSIGALDVPFIFDRGEFNNLNTRLPPGSGWILLRAEDINDKGQIVGMGYNPQGQQHAFLLSPL